MTFEECSGVAQGTLLPGERCRFLFEAALEAVEVGGSFYECGVYQGGSAHLLAEVIMRSHTDHELHLFDSFAGLPEAQPEIDYHWKGEFGDTSDERVLARLANYSFAQVHKGWIPEVFSERESDLIAFAHLDLDLYRSTKDALNFIWPRLAPGGIIVLDDYGCEQCRGVEQAVKDVLGTESTYSLVAVTDQAKIVKLGSKAA